MAKKSAHVAPVLPPVSKKETLELQVRSANYDANRLHQRIIDNVEEAAAYMQRKAGALQEAVAELKNESPVEERGRTLPAVRLVQNTVHEILWMVPNMNLDALVSMTAEYQAAVLAQKLASKNLQDFLQQDKEA